MAKRLNVLDQNKSSIINAYVVNNHTANKIAMQYNVHLATILNRLREWYIPIRKRGNNKHSIDNSVFDMFTPAMCYWVGYIAGDGCINLRDYGSYSISIVSKDREHLYKFKSFLNATQRVRAHSTNNTHQFSFVSNKIARRLKLFGLTTRKTLGLKIKSLHLLQSKDFWRGVIDSDGWISVRNAGQNIGIHTHSAQFKNQILYWFNKNWGIPMFAYNNNGGYKVQTAALYNTWLISKIVYDNTSRNIRMDRKWDNIKRVINRYES